MWINELCEHFFVLCKRLILFSFALHPQSPCTVDPLGATFYIIPAHKSCSFQFYMIFCSFYRRSDAVERLNFKKIFNHHHKILYSIQMGHRFAHFFVCFEIWLNEFEWRCVCPILCMTSPMANDDERWLFKLANENDKSERKKTLKKKKIENAWIEVWIVWSVIFGDVLFYSCLKKSGKTCKMFIVMFYIVDANSSVFSDIQRPANN